MIDFQVFNNITFSELWGTKEKFIEAYDASGLPKDGYLSNEDLELIWVLLLGRFADSTIKPYNTYGAFQIRFMSKVWQYGPIWKKELDIQNKLRNLSLENGSELFVGGTSIHNSAMNPGTAPSTNDIDELNFINTQNTTKHKKSKLEGYLILSESLKKDITEGFLRRFDEMFKTIIYSGKTYLYKTELGE